MELSDQAQKYLILFGVLLVIVFVIYDASSNKFTCDGWANDFKEHQSFNLVLSKKENNYSRDAYLYGIDLKNKQPTEFYDGGGWIARNFDIFKIGDSLIKDKGKYTIIIKRKGKTILVPFKCGSNIYVDK